MMDIKMELETNSVEVVVPDYDNQDAFPDSKHIISEELFKLLPEKAKGSQKMYEMICKIFENMDNFNLRLQEVSLLLGQISESIKTDSESKPEKKEN
uniref:Uncharacterized protein n=1 Tax=Strigamia maritima TaxID=126957 RepID=T1IVF0_STRMM